MPVRILYCVLLLFASVAASLSTPLPGQSVQPVIVEYKGNAEGKLTLTNASDAPMAVVLEPKSFSISPDGRGVFRPLDSSIHLRLSSMSVRLLPRQTYYVFYSASSDTLPAWFTVYATFSQVSHGPGIDVRVMLPHTVYLYQKQSLAEGDVQVTDAVYSPQSGKVFFTLENKGSSLARVQDVRVTGNAKADRGANHGTDSAEVEGSGFPFLPGGLRRIEIDWKKPDPPNEIALRFEHFTVKRPVTAREE